jgi:hypothetical protein
MFGRGFDSPQLHLRGKLISFPLFCLDPLLIGLLCKECYEDCSNSRDPWRLFLYHFLIAFDHHLGIVNGCLFKSIDYFTLDIGMLCFNLGIVLGCCQLGELLANALSFRHRRTTRTSPFLMLRRSIWIRAFLPVP